MRPFDDREVVDPLEVLWVASEQGRSFAMATAAIIASCDLAAGLPPERRNEAATRPKTRCRLGVKRQGVEIGFDLLQHGLPGLLLPATDDQGAYRQLRQGDRGDEHLLRQGARA